MEAEDGNTNRIADLRGTFGITKLPETGKEEMSMVQATLTVNNVKGLHIKPAGEMSRIALSRPCRVYLRVREYEVNAKSVLGILSAQVKCGEQITVVCDGEGEEYVLKEIEAAVNNRFGIE